MPGVQIIVSLASLGMLALTGWLALEARNLARGRGEGEVGNADDRTGFTPESQQPETETAAVGGGTEAQLSEDADPNSGLDEPGVAHGTVRWAFPREDHLSQEIGGYRWMHTYPGLLNLEVAQSAVSAPEVRVDLTSGADTKGIGDADFGHVPVMLGVPSEAILNWIETNGAKREHVLRITNINAVARALSTVRRETDQPKPDERDDRKVKGSG